MYSFRGGRTQTRRDTAVFGVHVRPKGCLLSFREVLLTWRVKVLFLQRYSSNRKAGRLVCLRNSVPCILLPVKFCLGHKDFKLNVLLGSSVFDLI